VEQVLQLLDVDRGADQGEELSGFEGLLEVVVGTGSEPGHDVGHVGAPGEEDDRDVAELGVGLELSEYLVAVEAGHDDVEQDDAGRAYEIEQVRLGEMTNCLLTTGHIFAFP